MIPVPHQFPPEAWAAFMQFYMPAARLQLQQSLRHDRERLKKLASGSWTPQKTAQIEKLSARLLRTRAVFNILKDLP